MAQMVDEGGLARAWVLFRTPDTEAPATRPELLTAFARAARCPLVSAHAWRACGAVCGSRRRACTN